MKIGISEVRRISGLANLEFDDSELARIAEQLSSILTYMERLGQIDTSGVEPTFLPVMHAAPMREDIPRPGLGAEEATRGAPGDSSGQFLVPRIIG